MPSRTGMWLKRNCLLTMPRWQVPQSAISVLAFSCLSPTGAVHAVAARCSPPGGCRAGCRPTARASRGCGTWCTCRSPRAALMFFGLQDLGLVAARLDVGLARPVAALAALRGRRRVRVVSPSRAPCPCTLCVFVAGQARVLPGVAGGLRRRGRRRLGRGRGSRRTGHREQDEGQRRRQPRASLPFARHDVWTPCGRSSNRDENAVQLAVSCRTHGHGGLRVQARCPSSAQRGHAGFRQFGRPARSGAGNPAPGRRCQVDVGKCRTPGSWRGHRRRRPPGSRSPDPPIPVPDRDPASRLTSCGRVSQSWLIALPSLRLVLVVVAAEAARASPCGRGGSGGCPRSASSRERRCACRCAATPATACPIRGSPRRASG